MSTLAGRWRALQDALEAARAGDHKVATSICAVVRTASELRASEGAEAEILELHQKVKAVIEGRIPIDGTAQQLEEPLALEAPVAPAAELADATPEPRPFDVPSEEKSEEKSE